MQPKISSTQTAALVYEQGGPVTFVHDYPVPRPRENEVLVKVLYTGVCQSDLHTKNGTATGADGSPITNIKLPHVGGHEGVGRVVAVGSSAKASETSTNGVKSSHHSPCPVRIGALVGIRFVSRVCQACEYCNSNREQHCKKQTNHLHHEDGSFQEYIVMDQSNLAVLPDDIDPALAGPVLCAGVTAYKAAVSAQLNKGDILVVLGAGGGLGHLAVQYGQAFGARVIGVDIGKKEFVESLGDGKVEYLEVAEALPFIQRLGGAHAVIVTSGHAKAYACVGGLLRVGGSLSMVGIPPGDVLLDIPIAAIVINGIRVTGNLVGSLREAMEAVELLRVGKVKPRVQVLPFKALGEVYERLERGDVEGRIVLKIAEDE